LSLMVKDYKKSALLGLNRLLPTCEPYLP